MSLTKMLEQWIKKLVFQLMPLSNAALALPKLFSIQVYKARDVGVNSIVLFPKIPDALKVCMFIQVSTIFFIFKYEVCCTFLFIQSQAGDEAFNDNGLVPRAIRLLKDKYPDIVSHLSCFNIFCTFLKTRI